MDGTHYLGPPDLTRYDLVRFFYRDPFRLGEGGGQGVEYGNTQPFCWSIFLDLTLHFLPSFFSFLVEAMHAHVVLGFSLSLQRAVPILISRARNSRTLRLLRLPLTSFFVDISSTLVVASTLSQPLWHKEHHHTRHFALIFFVPLMPLSTLHPATKSFILNLVRFYFNK